MCHLHLLIEMQHVSPPFVVDMQHVSPQLVIELQMVLAVLTGVRKVSCVAPKHCSGH